MAHHLSSYLLAGPRSPRIKKSGFAQFSASLDTGVEGVKFGKSTSVLFEEARTRVAKVIHRPEVSVSVYDTAWVAMVPSSSSSLEPCFPDCINWLLDNQNEDGSWARSHHHSLLQKDVLSSTLACVLALKRWKVGEYQIRKGVRFIEAHFGLATEKSQISPVGFDIIFPGMLEYARGLSLNLKLDSSILNDLIGGRDLELKRCCENQSLEMKAYLAYLSEGIQSLQDSDLVLKYQRRNGSLFNSPATTAAAYIIHHDAGCLNYLQSVLKEFRNAVPAVYPLSIHAKLCTVDGLVKLGIIRHFRNEIQSVLDETYRCWLQGDEEIFMDAYTCALAFRLLRMNGYDVTSDPLTQILEEDFLVSSHSGHVIDATLALELLKASEMSMNTTESVLQKHNLRLKHLLGHELNNGFSNSSELRRKIDREVNNVLQYPFYAILPRMENRRNIEQYNLTNPRISKTSYSLPNSGNKDMIFMSVTDFNELQAIHCKELKAIERWVVENRLDELKFARSKSAYCYFSAAASFFSPDLSDARLSWAKNGVLTTIVDDFFDVGGSLEELKQLIQLVEAYRWDENIGAECSSQNVRIIFSAIKSTIDEIGEKAYIRQERRVKDHVIDVWLDLLKSMHKETEWANETYVPTMDEYMINGHVSFALGPIVLPALYLVGPKLSEDMISHSEYRNLFKLMSSCGRLLNDIHSHERESRDGKLNALSLHMMKGGEMTKEGAVAEIKEMVDNQRRELLRLVVERKNSVIPRACKDLFWHMSTVLHLFYIKDDGFTSQELIKVVKTIIHEPVVVNGVGM